MFSPVGYLCNALVAVLALWPTASHATVIRGRSVTISYKQTKICETTPGVKSYSGYITIPASADPSLQPYDANMFFWFFEARDSPLTAPLTLWLQGGPGSASTVQAVSGHNGPCAVQSDSNSTMLNPWSWNNVANMLYLDQPVQVGYSYDVATDGTMDMLTGAINAGEVNSSTYLLRKGVFASQDMRRTANTTAIAMKAIQEFLDLWFDRFPIYKRDGVNIWTQSYGGHYAPSLASALMDRRLKPQCRGRRGSCGPGVDSVGIINGFIDGLAQAPYWPQFAVNNTYDIRAYNQSTAEAAAANLYQPGGCRDAVLRCHQLAVQSDPDDYGNNTTTNGACLAAFALCWGSVYGYYENPRYAQPLRDPFDIARTTPVSFPPPYALGYLNNKWVRDALGAKINFTASDAVVANMFVSTGDYIRGNSLAQLASIADYGVKIALLHGDRDFRANWLGGEAVSLALPYSKKAAFAAAGYASITTGAGRTGGAVRQHGLVSFSRVFDAGHEVPYYQPETAYRIFSRTILGRDVATGIIALALRPGYSSAGPASAFGIRNSVPPPRGGECYVDYPDLPLRCTPEQLAALADGTAVVRGRVVVSPPPAVSR